MKFYSRSFLMAASTTALRQTQSTNFYDKTLDPCLCYLGQCRRPIAWPWRRPPSIDQPHHRHRQRLFKYPSRQSFQSRNLQLKFRPQKAIDICNRLCLHQHLRRGHQRFRRFRRAHASLSLFLDRQLVSEAITTIAYLTRIVISRPRYESCC